MGKNAEAKPAMRRSLMQALAFVLIGCWPEASLAQKLEKIPDLGGSWTGPGLSLFIDPSRHQANADATKPFNRQPFIIRNVTGPMIVFVIGPDLFVAQMSDPNTMVVTRGGLLESYTLTRRKR